MTITYTGHTQIFANSDLDALVASVAAVQPAVYNASMSEFNVRDVTFGALGNGVHDDTSAFAGALAAAAVAGGLVRVPRGTYKVSSQMTLASNVVLQGDGAGVSVISAPAMGAMVIFSGQSVTKVAVDGLGFSGVFGKGIYFADSSKISVTNCAISGATVPVVADGFAAGVQTVRSTDVVIENNYFIGNGYPVDGFLTADITVNGAGSLGYPRIYVRNNRCLSSDVHINIQCYNIQESEITGNEAANATMSSPDNSGYGILAYWATIGTQWDAVTNYVPGNIVYIGPVGHNGEHWLCIAPNINQTPPNVTYWTLMDHGVRDNIISGNNIHDTEGLGIYVANGVRNLVTNNQLRNVCSLQSEAGLPASGIGINGGSATVSHNRIEGCGRSGIALAAPFGPTVVTSNTVSNAAGFGGIILRGDCTGIRVSDNVVEDSTGTGIGSNNTLWTYTDISVTGNRVLRSGGGGIFLTNSTGGTVAKNTVGQSGGHGIYIYTGGKNNSVTGNISTDSSQLTPNTYADISFSSPQTTVSGNVTGNTLANGAKYGVANDAAGAVGSSVTCNVGKDHRTSFLNLASGTTQGANVDATATTGTSAGAHTLGQLAQLNVQGNFGTQIELGTSGSGGAVGTIGSTADTYLADNAKTVVGSGGLTWHQNDAAKRSVLVLMKETAGQNIFEIFLSALGTADANFATFWGTAKFGVDTNGSMYVAGIKVVGPQGPAVADVATADATDLPTAITLVNALKASHNVTLARLRTATGHGLIA